MYEDEVSYALKVAEELGVTYAEARYHGRRGLTLTTRNGELLGVGRDLSVGIGIRVLVEGALGFSSTNRLDRASIREAVEDAYRLAKVHAKLMREKIEFGEAKLGRASYRVLERRAFDSMDLSDKVLLLRELWKRVQDSVRESRVVVVTSTLTEYVEEKTVASTDGALVASRVPRLSFNYSFVIATPEKGTIQRRFLYGASGGLELLDEWKPIETAAEEAARLEGVLLEGRSPPSGEIDVVVGSEIVGLAVHESCGHPSEADRILGREAAQAGMSFIKPGMLGQRIGTELVTVIDDPTIPGSNGFYLYDDEGVPARPRYLYREGLINEHLHNRWTARVFGVESNGAARSMNYRSEPIIRMANTYFKPGDYGFEELLEDVKLGVYVKSYMEWNIDDERWSQRYVGLEAYTIVRGELGEPVRNPVLELTTKGFYSRVDAVGKDLHFYAGTCGKGEPGQGVPVWFGGPDLRLRRVKLGVVA